MYLNNITLFNLDLYIMIQILIIKKNGDIDEKKVKKIEDDKIYKLCSYKNNNNFEMLHDFSVNGHNYIVYGKTKGNANHENKYELPPPIDKDLYFGSLCILKKSTDDYEDLHHSEWEEVYEQLFGGFEDIGNSEDESRSMDSEIYSDEEYTEEGYLKDGFIVDDADELMEEEVSLYDTSDEEEENE